MLGDTQIERYSRQIILPQVGGKGQEEILRSRVYVDGDGLLTACALFYLAAAGVGTIGMARSNAAAGVGTIGMARSNAAPVFSAFAEQYRRPDTSPVANTLGRLNPDCTIVTHTAEAEQLVQQYDLIVATTAALHDVCYAQHKPFVWTAVTRERGQLFVSRGDRDAWPCLRCLFPVSSAAYDGGRGAGGTPVAAAPVDAPQALFAGAQQATEALKIIVQADAGSRPKLLEWTVPAFHFTQQTVEKHPYCSVCATPAG